MIEQYPYFLASLLLLATIPVSLTPPGHSPAAGGRFDIENVAKVTKDSASGAHESAKASQDLSQLAVELQNIVGEFKI